MTHRFTLRAGRVFATLTLAFAMTAAWPQATPATGANQRSIIIVGGKPAVSNPAAQAVPRPATTVLAPATRPATTGPQAGNVAPGTALQTGATPLQGPATLAGDLKGKDLYYCRGFGDGHKLSTGRHGSAGPTTEVYVIYLSGPQSRAAVTKTAVMLEPGTCGIVGKPWGKDSTRLLTVKLPEPGAALGMQRVIADLSSADVYYEFVVSEFAPNDLRVEKFGAFTPTLAHAPVAPLTPGDPCNGCTGTSSSALVTGTPYTESEMERLGLVHLNISKASPMVCSASLLRNGWVITAAHCVEKKWEGDPRGPESVVPSAVQVQAGWMELDVNAQPVEIWRKVVSIRTFRPDDVALLQLDRPIAIRGRTFGFEQPVRTSANIDALASQPITIMGAGTNMFAQQTTAPDGSRSTTRSSNDRRWRWGTSQVSFVKHRLLWIPNLGNGTTAGGDSGGPSFVSNQLVSVHSSCRQQCADGEKCGKDNPGGSWDFVTNTTFCQDAPVGLHWPKIVSTMNASILPAAPAGSVREMPYGAMRYTRPTIVGEDGQNHYLDGCENLAEKCAGAVVAENFCGRQNPKKPSVLDFSTRRGVGVSAVFATRQLCNGPGCGAFEHITCINKVEYQVRANETLLPNQNPRIAEDRGTPDPRATAVPAPPLPVKDALRPKANASAVEAASGKK